MTDASLKQHWKLNLLLFLIGSLVGKTGNTYYKMGLTLNELLNQKQSDLIWEVFVGDVDGWFARFLEDEKVPPRKGMTTNILAIIK